MTKTLVKPRTKVRTKTQRPPLYKVILLNDDYTPREFVVLVLKAVFRMNEDQAYRVMMTAHQKGACVIAVYARDVAETKAKEATELGKQKGYPLSSPLSRKNSLVFQGDSANFYVASCVMKIQVFSTVLVRFQRFRATHPRHTKG